MFLHEWREISICLSQHLCWCFYVPKSEQLCLSLSIEYLVPFVQNPRIKLLSIPRLCIGNGPSQGSNVASFNSCFMTTNIQTDSSFSMSFYSSSGLLHTMNSPKHCYGQRGRHGPLLIVLWEGSSSFQMEHHLYWTNAFCSPSSFEEQDWRPRQWEDMESIKYFYANRGTKTRKWQVPWTERGPNGVEQILSCSLWVSLFLSVFGWACLVFFRTERIARESSQLENAFVVGFQPSSFVPMGTKTIIALSIFVGQRQLKSTNHANDTSNTNCNVFSCFRAEIGTGGRGTSDKAYLT